MIQHAEASAVTQFILCLSITTYSSIKLHSYLIRVILLAIIQTTVTSETLIYAIILATY